MTLPLMKHQIAGVKFLHSQPIGMLLFDRGAGKTPTVLTELDEKLEIREVKCALYVAPLSTLENVRRECHRFAKNIRPVVLDGTRAERIKALDNRNANLFIINYEGLKAIFPEMMARQQDFQYVVLDESTRVKDRNTQIAKAVKILARSWKYKRLLTGMPFTEGPQDAWSQFHFLDPKILGENYYVFRNRYCQIKVDTIWITVKDPKTGRTMHKQKPIRKIVGARNLDELESRVRPYVFRVSKEDCLDLPPKVFQTLEVNLTEEQLRRYKIVEREIESEISGEIVTHAVALAKMQKLRQVAAGFMYSEDHDALPIHTAKYREIAEFLQESMYGKRKAVVFTSFRAEPAMLVEAIGRLPGDRLIKCFTLPDEPTERQPEVDRWKSWEESPAVLIGNVRSGGTGLNLQAADIAIFASNDWRMEDRAQAEDRVHRYGSEVFNKILIVDFVTRDTIEEDILTALKDKRDLVEVFLERIRQKQRSGSWKKSAS